ncbi:hypothetical protein CCASEI_03905 [Corynebacterium casei LMG S-19264]|uniref:Uncharacterized protein n=1 Tax=Corynebacterium casei LMG S-19264 TaxID=1285583 RepID=A0ABN4CA84_9CORY|nr:hypothetical protein CCASEI_03905 [Corynebacterium casei LMG S-19264]
MVEGEFSGLFDAVCALGLRGFVEDIVDAIQVVTGEPERGAEVGGVDEWTGEACGGEQHHGGGRRARRAGEGLPHGDDDDGGEHQLHGGREADQAGQAGAQRAAGGFLLGAVCSRQGTDPCLVDT